MVVHDHQSSCLFQLTLHLKYKIQFSLGERFWNLYFTFTHIYVSLCFVYVFRYALGDCVTKFQVPNVFRLVSGCDADGHIHTYRVIYTYIRVNVRAPLQAACFTWIWLWIQVVEANLYTCIDKRCSDHDITNICCSLLRCLWFILFFFFLEFTFWSIWLFF